MTAPDPEGKFGFRIDGGVETWPLEMILPFHGGIVLVELGWDDPLNAGARIHFHDRIQEGPPGTWDLGGVQLRDLSVVKEATDLAAAAEIKRLKVWPVDPDRRAAALDFAEREFSN